MLNVKCSILVGIATINICYPLIKPETARALERTRTIGQSDRIICLSTSGNGYNWASTLTWAAEILRNTVESNPEDRTFNVACASGASSGSAFAAAYGSLLQNKKLFSRPDFHPQAVTREEVLILAKSLIYLGLSADFPAHIISFYLTKDGENNPDPPWWKSEYSHDRIMLDFGSKIMLAQQISLKDINRVDRLQEFIRYKSPAELAAAAKNRDNLARYRRLTKEIWRNSETIINKQYRGTEFKRRSRQQDRDDFKNNPQHPVRKALAKSPPDGIMSLIYGELAFTRSTVAYKKLRSSPPPAENLVPFVFANKNTARSIINSPFYQERVNNKDPYVGQYVISVVPNYYAIIRHGLREPGLNPLAIHNLIPTSDKLPLETVADISRFYQPNTESKWEQSPQFRMIPGFRSLPQNDDFYRLRMGIAGGWVDSYVGGQATLYLGSSYAARQQKSRIVYSTFSRQDRIGQFAANAIDKYFAPDDPEAAIAAVEKHRQYLPQLIEIYNQRSPRHQIQWQPIFINWQLFFFPENQNLLELFISNIDKIMQFGYNRLPAATTQQSNYLVARTMNLVRKTLGADVVESQGYIYDRAYDEKLYEEIGNNRDNE